MGELFGVEAVNTVASVFDFCWTATPEHVVGESVRSAPAIAVSEVRERRLAIWSGARELWPSDPLEPVRSDPRYQEIVARIELPEQRRARS